MITESKWYIVLWSKQSKSQCTLPCDGGGDGVSGRDGDDGVAKETENS